MKESAGTLLYRHQHGVLSVLIVHPSGNYNRRAPWSIPKGLPSSGESFEDAARRETLEETGIIAGELVPLGDITYTKSRKRVHAFAGPYDVGTPTCASWEVDQVEFVPVEQARGRLHSEQVPFLDRLIKLLEERKD
jgi:predicted NUDIX family NTP pyrophosphohydrolase